MTPAYQIHFAKGLLRIGACEKLYDLLEGIIRDSSNLFIRSILDWMWHKQHRRVVTQGCRLCFRSFYKFGSSDANPKDTTIFQVHDVMRTARRARTSIGQPFNNSIDFRCDLLAQVCRCRTGKRGLRVTFNRNACVRKALVYTVKKDVPSRF